jgi:hypothetical protein
MFGIGRRAIGRIFVLASSRMTYLSAALGIGYDDARQNHFLGDAKWA